MQRILDGSALVLLHEIQFVFQSVRVNPLRPFPHPCIVASQMCQHPMRVKACKVILADIDFRLNLMVASLVAAHI